MQSSDTVTRAESVGNDSDLIQEEDPWRVSKDEVERFHGFRARRRTDVATAGHSSVQVTRPVRSRVLPSARTVAR